MPNPLHPAIVHFPIALAVLVPVLVFVGLIAIHRGVPARSWLLVVGFGAALALSSWLAVETGEDQEEAVEAVVPEAAIHEHEEAAEALLVTSGILFLLLSAGLASGRVGRTARIVSAPASLVLLVMVFRVGASGGELVYEHGAASAYASPSAQVSETSDEHGEDEEEEEEEHGEERGRRR
jgi:uncharacterized membrane protein